MNLLRELREEIRHWPPAKQARYKGLIWLAASILILGTFIPVVPLIRGLVSDPMNLALFLMIVFVALIAGIIGFGTSLVIRRVFYNDDGTQI